MGTVASSIALRDNMTSTINGMLRSMNTMISTFEGIEKASQNAIDTKSLAAARSEINKAGAAFQEFEKNVKSAAEKNEKFKDSAKSVNSSIIDLGSSSAFAVAKIVAIPAVITAAGLACVKAAADMETTKVSFTTMLGSADSANTMLAQLQSFAANTPYEFTEVTAAAKSLLAFGVSAQDVTATLTALGDVSSGISAPIGEIAEIYGKAKVQGRLFAEDINQLTGRGIPIIQQLAKQFGVTEDRVKGLVEDGAVGFNNLEQAFKDLTKEGSQFGGMMKNQSATLNGQWSNLMDNIGQSSVLAGNALVEAFNIKGAVGNAVNAVGDLKSALQSQEFQDFVDQVGTNFATASASFNSNFDQIVDKVVVRAPEMQQAFGAVQRSWTTFFNRITADNEALNKVDWHSALLNTMDYETQKVAGMIMIVTNLGTVLTDVGNMMVAFWQGGDAFMESGSKFAQDIASMKDGWDQLSQAGDYAKAVSQTDPNTILASGMEASRGSVVDQATQTRTSIQEQLDPLKIFSQTTGQNTGDGIVQGLKDRESAITTGGDSAATALKDSFRNALGIHSPSTVFRDFGYYAIDGLIEGLSNTELLDFCNSIVADMQAAFKAGNFNLQAGIQFLGSGAEDFFKSIGIGAIATIGDLLWPTASQDITSGFGYRSDAETGGIGSNWHEGIDIGAAYGDAVMAAAAGQVIFAGENGGFGNMVEIDHGNGLTTLYAHLSKIDAVVGQIVSAGQKIGEVGSTGNSTGPHLHFGVYQNGQAIDPLTANFGGATGGDSSASSWIQQALSIAGINASQAEFDHLMQLAYNESTYNPSAYNDSGASGFMQTKPFTFESYKVQGHNDIWNPVDNAIAAIRYMIDRYGSILATPLDGYATGTNFATRGLHLVGERGPEIVNFGGGETVLNAEKTAKILNSAKSGNGSSTQKLVQPVVNVTMGDNIISSEVDAKKVIKIMRDELEEQLAISIKQAM